MHYFYFFSQATVARRREELGLKGSGAITKALPLEVRRQLILDQLSKDPTSQSGPSTIQANIHLDTGIKLTR